MHRSAPNIRTVSAVVRRMKSASFLRMNVPKAESLATTFLQPARSSMPFAPGFPTLVRCVFQHSGVLQDECDIRACAGQIRGARHLVGKDLQVETPAEVGQFGDVALAPPVRRASRGARQTDTRGFRASGIAGGCRRMSGKSLQLFQLRPDILGGEVGKSDDGVRPPPRVGD